MGLWSNPQQQPEGDEMTERTPPKMAQEAPGLVWRKRANGWAATWQARSDVVEKGYRPKSVTLWTGVEPDPIEAMHIATQCQQYQGEMRLWSRGIELPPNAFKGSLQSLIQCYRTDADSPYQKNRFHVRQNRDSMLRRIGARYGQEMLSDIKARVLLTWHKDFSQNGKRLATGSAFIGQLRALFSFGATLLEDTDCERLCGVMHKMRFPGTKARGVSVSFDQAAAIIAKARDHFGWYSLALGQAFQFECTLRQKDVIGELVPLSEPGISDIIVRGQKWLRGLRWEEIDQNLILRHVTSKKQKLAEVDLKLAPLVLAELQWMAGVAPLILTDPVTKKITVDRILLPATGPIMLCDTNGTPWTGNEYRRKWRKVARACGLPDDVWNMDSRSGAISEAIQAGAPIEFVRHAATHSDVSQTADYDRGQAEATAKVMRMRMDARNNKKNDD
jgi:hypothetical protein